MTFSEYLLAAGEDLFLKELNKIEDIRPFPEAIYHKMINHLKLYLYLGGMPEVVNNYIETRDIATVRLIQRDILKALQCYLLITSWIAEIIFFLVMIPTIMPGYLGSTTGNLPIFLVPSVSKT